MFTRRQNIGVSSEVTLMVFLVIVIICRVFLSAQNSCFDRQIGRVDLLKPVLVPLVSLSLSQSLSLSLSLLLQLLSLSIFSRVLRDSICHYVGWSVRRSVGPSVRRSIGRSVTHQLFSHFFIILSVIMSIQSIIKLIQSVIKSIQSLIESIQSVIK